MAIRNYLRGASSKNRVKNSRLIAVARYDLMYLNINTLLLSTEVTFVGWRSWWAGGASVLSTQPSFYMHQFYNLRNYLSVFEGFESPKFKANIGNHPSSLARQTRLGGSETWDDLEAGAPGG